MSTPEPDVSALSEHPFLADLAGATLDELEECGQAREYGAGEYLLRIGEPADGMYLLTSGRVALEVPAGAGRVLAVDSVDGGGVVGWSWVVEPYRWQFDGRAVTDTRAIHLPKECLDRAFERDPAFGVAVLRRFAAVIADRLGHTRLRLFDVYGAPADDPPASEGGATT